MRLLTWDDNDEFTFTKDFIDDDAIPSYAILSHTWSVDGEVTYNDILKGTGKSKTGYDKLRFCKQQTKCNGLRYFWVDSCCIDKSNSAELQEAINSMFRFYRNAKLCYVYLSDVPTYNQNEVGPSLQPWEPDFRRSRWFKRGWTLQELLAPKDLQFFDREGDLLGSKKELRDIISTITNISPDVLAGQDIKGCSIAQRMSWAANRNTTRSEDMAYSLMGIFDVNMPLLYGEGREKAFYRLQEEIMKRSDDHSLFAWKLQTRYAVHGLLAPSPAAFKNSQHIIPCITRGRRTPYSSTNQGLQINLQTAEHLRNGLHAAALNCMDQRTGSRLGIFLKQIGENHFVRTRLDQLPKLGLDRWAKEFKPFEYKTIYIPQVPLRSYHPQHKFRSLSKLAPRLLGKGALCPYTKNTKTIMAALSMCARCPAGKIASQVYLYPRQDAIAPR
jgi:hypothetical protein